MPQERQAHQMLGRRVQMSVQPHVVHQHSQGIRLRRVFNRQAIHRDQCMGLQVIDKLQNRRFRLQQGKMIRLKR